MRTGIAFIPGMPVGTVVDLAREAEALGYDDLFIPDQTFHRDPFALLALCAKATSKIRLGLAVTNPYTRHPVQIARAAGLLAELTEGRFLLGLGAGNRPRLLAGMGIRQTHVLARLREAVEVIRRLVAGETVEYESQTLTLRGVHLDFDPSYPVPIALAGRGPRVLSLAGEIADGAMLEGLFTPSALVWGLARVGAGAALAGRSVADVETFAWQALVLLDDPALAEQPSLRRWAALLIHTTGRDVLAQIGVSEAAIESVEHEIKARGGVGEPSGDGVGRDDVARLLLVGTPEQLRDRIERLQHGGVSALACVLFGDAAEISRAMRRLAEQVLAAI